VAAIAPFVDARRFDPDKDDYPSQCRFDPIHDTTICPGGDQLGGYIYVGLSISAVVAEGVLRNVEIPASNILPSAILEGRSIIEMEMGEDIDVVTLDDQYTLSQTNLDASIYGCTFEFYGEPRKNGTNILVSHQYPNGIRYDCRHGKKNLAMIVVESGRAHPRRDTIAVTSDFGVLLCYDVRLRYDRKTATLISEARRPHDRAEWPHHRLT
jgi:hypothetical protein